MNRNDSIIISIALILNLVVDLKNVMYYNLLSFYILCVILPSILYSSLANSILDRIQYKKIFLSIIVIFHFFLNWFFLRILLTEKNLKKIIDNTMLVNSEMSNSVTLNMSVKSLVEITLFVVVLIYLERNSIKKWRRKENVFE